MSSSIAQNIEALCQEQGIERDLVIEAMKEAVRAAAKKQFRSGEDIQVDWNSETGIELSASKVVVDEVENPATELSITEARELAGDEVELGDALLLPLPMEELGRIAAQTAKQILFQKVRDAVRSNVYEQYIDKIGDLVNGYVKRFERGNIIVEKQTIPDGASESFSFSGDVFGSISDGQQLTVNNVAPGTYTSTEADPTPGFDLTSISCDDGASATPSTTSLGTRTATFKVDPGETVTIRFGFRNSAGTNAQNMSATLLATNGVTPVTSSQNYGAMIVGDPVTSRPFFKENRLRTSGCASDQKTAIRQSCSPPW